jgi:hypothetical protein
MLFIVQVRTLQQQLKQVAPHLSKLGNLSITEGCFLSDVFFDNIFTDMAMHNKIKESEMQVVKAGHHCEDMERESEQRGAQVQRDLQSANLRLSNAKIELQQAREAAFTSVLQRQWAAATAGNAPPLEYLVETSGV